MICIAGLMRKNQIKCGMYIISDKKNKRFYNDKIVIL